MTSQLFSLHGIRIKKFPPCAGIIYSAVVSGCLSCGIPHSHLEQKDFGHKVISGDNLSYSVISRVNTWVFCVMIVPRTDVQLIHKFLVSHFVLQALRHNCRHFFLCHHGIIVFVTEEDPLSGEDKRLLSMEYLLTDDFVLRN